MTDTFSTGADGWKVGDINNSSTTMESPTFNSTGGNPGGYISTTDDYAESGFFAPDEAKGNQLAYCGGTVSFDLSDAQTDPGTEPALFIYGNGQVISIAGPVPGTTFTHFSFNITQSGFDYYTGNDEQGTVPVSEAAFKAILSDVTNVAIQADWHTGYDLTALDNVSATTGVVSAVPLPASAPMFGAALLALGAVGYGVKRKGKAAV